MTVKQTLMQNASKEHKKCFKRENDLNECQYEGTEKQEKLLNAMMMLKLFRQGIVEESNAAMMSDHEKGGAVGWTMMAGWPLGDVGEKAIFSGL